VPLLLYLLAIVSIVVGRKFKISCRLFLIPLLVVAMCTEDGLVPKFENGNSREFVYWAVIILLRSTLIMCEFGQNQVHEIVCAVGLPTITIFGNAFTLKGEQNSYHAIAPCLGTFIAVLVFLVVRKVTDY
jgi:hypothetical protein